MTGVQNWYVGVKSKIWVRAAVLTCLGIGLKSMDKSAIGLIEPWRSQDEAAIRTNSGPEQMLMDLKARLFLVTPLARGERSRRPISTR